jgi:processive 1,2-diacylglycerol beta-glucosyltransferase
MPKQCKLLFISAPVGAGHIRAAQAVAKALQQADPAIQTQLANIFDFFNPFLGRAILKIYLKVLAVFPGAYGMMYGWGNASSLALWGRKIISGYLGRKMYHYILAYKPDAIVCTHATPAGLVAYLLRNFGLRVPVFAVVTDFVVHRLWVYPEIYRYYVANESLRGFLAENGIPIEHSRALGIPVDAAFSIATEREAVLRQLNLPLNGKIILLMGGGAGILPMVEILTACDELAAPFHFIAVAGNNQQLITRLAKLKDHLRHSLTVLPFVNNVHELMAVANLLISKPGGLTAAEALAKNLPLIIFHPIPGQEEANTRYLVEQNCARRADTLADLQSALRQLLPDHSEELANLRAYAHQAGRPEAAQSIAADIIAVLHKKSALWKICP